MHEGGVVWCFAALVRVRALLKHPLFPGDNLKVVAVGGEQLLRLQPLLIPWQRENRCPPGVPFSGQKFRPVHFHNAADSIYLSRLLFLVAIKALGMAPPVTTLLPSVAASGGEISF